MHKDAPNQSSCCDTSLCYRNCLPKSLPKFMYCSKNIHYNSPCLIFVATSVWAKIESAKISWRRNFQIKRYV